MREPRFDEKDKVRIVRILALNMDTSGDLEHEVFERYIEENLGNVGVIRGIEEKSARCGFNEAKGFNYLVRFSDEEEDLWFHEEELEYV